MAPAGARSFRPPARGGESITEAEGQPKGYSAPARGGESFLPSGWVRTASAVSWAKMAASPHQPPTSKITLYG
ncbi:hypothetical protein [Streptomyces sp. CoH27]|uniref:hypothetical protein n=1 Tax=Streptomyces sp. CoH27 TaxID=2875763 RepID=UPI001CD1DE07|nr:hypothetical protein [Streptomyces sp. CoH27]